MLLGQDGHLVAEKIPVTCGLAQRDNSDEESGCRCKIGSLSTTTSEQLETQRPRVLTANPAHLACLLLQQGELFDGPLKVVLAGVSSQNIRPSLNKSVSFGYLSEQFCLGDLLVDLLGKVLVGLERGVRHLGRLMMGNDDYGRDERMWR